MGNPKIDDAVAVPQTEPLAAKQFETTSQCKTRWDCVDSLHILIWTNLRFSRITLRLICRFETRQVTH